MEQEERRHSGTAVDSGVLRAAFASRQAQPDVGLHLGSQPVPAQVRGEFAQLDNLRAHRSERLHGSAALLAAGYVATRPPFRYKAEVMTGEQCQSRLVRVFHYRLLPSI